jgi:hypothetical protein
MFTCSYLHDSMTMGRSRESVSLRTSSFRALDSKMSCPRISTCLWKCAGDGRMDARDSAETNRRGGFDFAARRTRRAYGDRHASFVAVLAGVCTADAKIPPWCHPLRESVTLPRRPCGPPLPLGVGKGGGKAWIGLAGRSCGFEAVPWRERMMCSRSRREQSCR